MKASSWLIVPLALSICAPALADPPDGGQWHHARGGHPMKGKMLREKVGLSDAKAARVEAILEKYAPERKRIAARMREARQKLRTLVNQKSTDQAAYRALLDQIRGSRKTMQDLMEKAFAEISRDLTPGEQARLFLALDRARGKMGRGGHGHHGDDPGY